MIIVGRGEEEVLQDLWDFNKEEEVIRSIANSKKPVTNSCESLNRQNAQIWHPIKLQQHLTSLAPGWLFQE